MHETLKEAKKRLALLVSSNAPSEHVFTPNPHPPPSAKSTRSLCLPYPMLYLETSTPAHGFLVSFLPPSCCWTICSLHCFNGQESWTQAIFFLFPDLSWVFEIISFSLCFSIKPQSDSNSSDCQWLINPINSIFVVVIVSRLKLVGKWESRCCVGVFPPCVSVQWSISSPLL